MLGVIMLSVVLHWWSWRQLHTQKRSTDLTKRIAGKKMFSIKLSSQAQKSAVEMLSLEFN